MYGNGTIGLVIAILLRTVCALTVSNEQLNRRKVLQATASSIAAGRCLWMPPAHANSLQARPTTVTLSDGTTQFPLCSFGLQIYDNDTAYRLTKTALDVGYRNFFASVLAGNQRGFAKAVRDSVEVDRQNVFICGSVVSNRAQGYDAAYQATTAGWKRNLQEFAAGDIRDLNQILLDYPGPDTASIQGQWRSLEEMYEQGLVKTLGVSNFSPAQLDAVLQKATVKPVVNQLPYSVAYHTPNVIDENRKRGILVQAWAPLGRSLGGRFTPSMKAKCAEIGKKYNKSFAQVALRWIVETGASFTTQSQNKDHFAEDLDIFDFELSSEDMIILSSLA